MKNFRLLADVRVSLDDEATVVVGRNNSGKTSLTELFRRLTAERSTGFQLEDFSATCHANFVEAYRKYREHGDPNEVRDLLPQIELRIDFSYDETTTDFGPIANFVVDLDPECFSAVAVVAYRLADGDVERLFEGIELADLTTTQQRAEFFAQLRPRIPKLFRRQVWAQDPNDPNNRRDLEWSTLEASLCASFVSAQRGLDDVTDKEIDSLGKVFERLFTAARGSGTKPDMKETALELERAVEEVQTSLDKEFKDKLLKLVPSMQIIGYPGLDSPDMFTETNLDVEKLLTDNTKIRYTGPSGVSLPESYNGLGSRNLILILLKLVGYYRQFIARGATPGLQIVFIEEPEVHLHPQMQEVFIRQLMSFAKDIVDRDGAGEPWPVQFVISTHSSHIANEVPFAAVRYFLAAPAGGDKSLRKTEVKDLGSEETQIDREFLHQYLTLTKCDLFFADKAVLIEGTAERLLLPQMMSMIRSETEPNLPSQYVTILEVGGAFAHKFFDLLAFLELPTLVITDIDSVSTVKGKRRSCPVADGSHTSNACLKQWFDEDVSITTLLAASDSDKVKGDRRIAFQVPEPGTAACGRTFEDAFVLANREKVPLDLSGSDLEAAQTAYDFATTVKKAQFALETATSTDWTIPQYIHEALKWLLEYRLIDGSWAVTPVDEQTVGATAWTS